MYSIYVVSRFFNNINILKILAHFVYIVSSGKIIMFVLFNRLLFIEKFFVVVQEGIYFLLDIFNFSISEYPFYKYI